MAADQGGFGRSPTFLVGGERQRGILDEFHRQEQHLSEQYQKHKPLCFNANAYQKTHPKKMTPNPVTKKQHKDADATIISPMMLGVADGVSQIEDFGIDASELPNELLTACEELAMLQLVPTKAQEPYGGPIPLMREAYEATTAQGSTTILLAILDNSTMIHGKMHPMIAVLSIGDCEILIMRRAEGRSLPLQAVFHTEMQRIDGNFQSPLQVARVDDRVDPGFDESIAIDVIERGSAVHCLSAYEGDILVMGSDGVFDNLFLDEVVDICNDMLPQPAAGGKFKPIDPAKLGACARRIVEECHAKTRPRPQDGQYPDTPIGKGGKVDDTCCVVGEVLEFTESHSEAWKRVQRQRQWDKMFHCGSACCEEEKSEEDDDGGTDAETGDVLSKRNNKPLHHRGRDTSSDSEDEPSRCAIL